MNTPNHATDEQLAALLDGDTAQAIERTVVPSIFARPAKVRPEHPLAKKLYIKFRAGSALLTKDEAWEIANELDSLMERQFDLHAELAFKVEEARTTVARLVAEIRELRGDDETPPARTELVGLGRSDQPAERVAVSDNHYDIEEAGR